MPDHQVRPQQADHLSAETPRPVLHQPHGHILQNAIVPLPAYGWQQQVPQEGIPPPAPPAENAAIQVLIQDPHRFPPPYDYEAAYHQLHADYPPYMPMQQGGRFVQGVPGHPQAVAPEVQDNHDGIFDYAPADPAVGPPQYFPRPEPLPYQAPQALANAPPADCPGTRISMLHIEPGLA
ncbi:hypothetical protein EDB87DRAFT_1618949, partial [Lactarius vividus]